MTPQQRLDICRACEYRKETGPLLWCRVCYCNMNAKTLLKIATCPKGKWSLETDNTTLKQTVKSWNS